MQTHDVLSQPQLLTPGAITLAHTRRLRALAVCVAPEGVRHSSALYPVPGGFLALTAVQGDAPRGYRGEGRSPELALDAMARSMSFAEGLCREVGEEPPVETDAPHTRDLQALARALGVPVVHQHPGAAEEHTLGGVTVKARVLQAQESPGPMSHEDMVAGLRGMRDMPSVNWPRRLEDAPALLDELQRSPGEPAPRPSVADIVAMYRRMYAEVRPSYPTSTIPDSALRPTIPRPTPSPWTSGKSTSPLTLLLLKSRAPHLREHFVHYHEGSSIPCARDHELEAGVCSVCDAREAVPVQPEPQPDKLSTLLLEVLGRRRLTPPLPRQSLALMALQHAGSALRRPSRGPALADLFSPARSVLYPEVDYSGLEMRLAAAILGSERPSSFDLDGISRRNHADPPRMWEPNLQRLPGIQDYLTSPVAPLDRSPLVTDRPTSYVSAGLLERLDRAVEHARRPERLAAVLRAASLGAAPSALPAVGSSGWTVLALATALRRGR